MIFVTGDTHADFRRVSDFCNKMNTTKEDILIVLGDAGLNYYLNYKDDFVKKEVQQLPITVFCIHGNHEERPFNISSYKTKDWHNGLVYYEDCYPDILFAKDGELYDFNGKTCLVIGGAYSVDKQYRLSRGWSWFESEQPSDEIKKYVINQLDKVDWVVDYVFSHTTPLKYEPVEWFLDFIDQNTVDKTTEEWLDSIENKLNYKKWYCGHYHGSKTVDKLRLMFEDFIELGK